MDEKIEKRRAVIINITYFAIIAAIIVLIYLFGLPLVMPFIIAFCLVAVMNPFVRWLNSKLKIKKEILSFAMMAFLYGVVGFILFLLVMKMIDWSGQLYDILPTYYEDVIQVGLSKAWDTIRSLIQQLPKSIQNEIDTFQSSLMTGIRESVGELSKTGLEALSRWGKGVPNFVVSFIFTILLSFFTSLRYDQITAFFHSQLSEKAKHTWKEFKDVLSKSVGGYVKAMLILMVITFVELSIGFVILRVPYSIVIALGVAVLDALPVFGSGVVLLPWAVVELLQGNFKMAVGLVIIYGVISLIRKLIEPKIVGDNLGLNPLIALISVYIGFKLGNVMGMILMPIVAQTLLEFHKRGIITLYKDKKRDAVAEDSEPLVNKTKEKE